MILQFGSTPPGTLFLCFGVSALLSGEWDGGAGESISWYIRS